MSRIISGWFEYKGRKSTDFRVRLMDYSSYIRAKARGHAFPAVAMDGDIWVPEDAYDCVEIKRKCRCPMSRMDEVAAWLTGSGHLIFSWSPNLAYDARLNEKIEFRQASVGADPLMEFTVTFTCQPCRIMLPEAEAITITENGYVLENPGTASSKPRVKIAGSGSFSVSIGMETLFFSDVTDGGIIVDSKYMDAFSFDGTSLANDKFEGTPYLIAPGNNIVYWTLDDGGRIESIEILPRWRCL